MSLLTKWLNRTSPIGSEKTPIVIEKTAIHRDEAADMAVRVAIREGEKLAKAVKAKIAAAGNDYADALSKPLSDVLEESDNTLPGSLLTAVCTGVSAGIAQAALYSLSVTDGQDRVSHHNVAKKIAAWEVRVNNIGQTPLPWKELENGGRIHISYFPGTLAGGVPSLAHRTMQHCCWQWKTNQRKESAREAVALIVALLGITPPPDELAIDFAERFGIHPLLKPLPEEVIADIARHILTVETFWPDLLETRKLVWK